MSRAPSCEARGASCLMPASCSTAGCRWEVPPDDPFFLQVEALSLEEWSRMCEAHRDGEKHELVSKALEKLRRYGERGRDIVRIMVASWPEVASPYAHRLVIAERVLWGR